MGRLTPTARDSLATVQPSAIASTHAARRRAAAGPRPATTARRADLSQLDKDNFMTKAKKPGKRAQMCKTAPPGPDPPPPTFSRPWCSDFLRIARASGDVGAALRSLAVDPDQYSRARRTDPAFNAACTDLDELVDASVHHALAAQALTGSVGAIRLWRQIRAEALTAARAAAAPPPPPTEADRRAAYDRLAAGLAAAGEPPLTDAELADLSRPVYSPEQWAAWNR